MKKTHRRRRLFLVVVTLFGGTAGMAARPGTPTGPVVIAGGAIDPAHTEADVYIDTPDVPTIPPGPACKAAKTYVDYHQAGRYADISGLFADDGALLEPTRLNLRGKAAITQFYEQAIGKLKPDLAAVFYIGNATDCMVELSIRQIIDGRPRYRLASMDHFTVDKGGKVIRMIAFNRPSKIGLTPPRMSE